MDNLDRPNSIHPAQFGSTKHFGLIRLKSLKPNANKKAKDKGYQITLIGPCSKTT